jgi:hypothetical protein
MRIKYPIRNDSFTPCKTNEERRLYDRMRLLMCVIPAAKKLTQEAEAWREHKEARQHRAALVKYQTELRSVVLQLIAIRPDDYAITEA